MEIITSPSKLKVYEMCPKQYHWAYNLKLLQPFNKAYIVGTKYHELVEKFHNGEPMEIDEEHKEVLTRLIKKYKKNPVEGTVVDTEKRFELSIGDVTVRGVLDRLDTDKIVEYKTSSFDYTDKDVDTWQTDLYILYLYETTGMVFPMTYSVVNKTKAKTIKYVPQVITVTKTEEDMEKIRQKLYKTTSLIEEGIFNENVGAHCAYCPFGCGYSGTRNCPNGKYIKKTKGQQPNS